MPDVRDVILSPDLVDLRGGMLQLFPVLGAGNLLDVVSDQIVAEVQRALRHASSTAVHGAFVAGQASEISGEMGFWMAVGGERGDGRNCRGCLDLHGKRMTVEKFLDTKYTTECDGNCRCRFLPENTVADAGKIEAIAKQELVG